MISFGSRHQQFCTKRIPDSKQIKKKQSLEDNKKKNYPNHIKYFWFDA